MLACLVSSEASFLGLQRASSPVSSYSLGVFFMYVCVSSFSLVLGIPVIGLEPTLMASFNVIISKDSASKCCHILSYCGLGLQHMNFSGDTIQPIANVDFGEELKAAFLFPCIVFVLSHFCCV